MTKVTIICPTFDHQDTLYPVMESVKRQTFQDFEVIVIGDGSPQRTAEIMTEISRDDSRFQYRNFPKSERTGEPYRDIIIRESKSDIIAYICDDDLWLPYHLEWMVTALQTADFAHSMHHNIHLDGHVDGLLFQFNSLLLRQRVFDGKIRRTFGLTCGSHTRQAYVNLPHGWDTTPQGIPTDLNMWIKFAKVSKIKIWEYGYPTALHFKANLRKHSAPVKRSEELWEELDNFSKPEYVMKLLEKVSYLPYFAYLCKQAPKYLLSVRQVFEFYDIQIEELEPSELLAKQAKSNTLYFRQQSIRLLEMYWQYLTGRTNGVITEQLMSEYLQEKPENNDARLQLAMLYLGNEDFKQTEQLLAHLDTNNVSSEYIIPLAIAYGKQGKSPDAQKIIDILQSRGFNTVKLQSMVNTD